MVHAPRPRAGIKKLTPEQIADGYRLSKCPTCRGTGQYHYRKCELCKGSGVALTHIG